MDKTIDVINFIDKYIKITKNTNVSIILKDEQGYTHLVEKTDLNLNYIKKIILEKLIHSLVIDEMKRTGITLTKFKIIIEETTDK